MAKYQDLILTIFYWPEFRNTPEYGKISGFNFNVLKPANKIHPYFNFCLKFTFTCLGLVFYHFVGRDLFVFENKVFMLLSFSFTFSSLLSERHFLP